MVQILSAVLRSAGRLHASQGRPGQYSSCPGSTRCSECNEGYFANESGQTDCYGCQDEASPGGDFSWLWTTMRKELWDGEVACYEVDVVTRLTSAVVFGVRG